MDTETLRRKVASERARIVELATRHRLPAVQRASVCRDRRFIINLKTAKALGLTIPPSCRFRETGTLPRDAGWILRRKTSAF